MQNVAFVTPDDAPSARPPVRPEGRARRGGSLSPEALSARGARSLVKWLILRAVGWRLTSPE